MNAAIDEVLGARFAVLTLAACLVLPVTARAQKAVLRGTVVDSANNRLAGADVFLSGGTISGRSNGQGTFVITGITPGTHIIRVRLLGYQQVMTTLLFHDNDTLDVDIELAARAQSLPAVTVADSARDPILLPFYERRRSGRGTFIERQELEQNETRSLDVFLAGKIAGVTMVHDPKLGRVWLVGGEGANATLTRLPNGDPTDPKSPRNCYAQVYVDGMRMYAPSAMAANPVPDLRSFRIAELEAVEYYSGPASTPPEFGGTGASCGTLVLWTRHR